jgi:hypothetical protein
LAGSDPDESLDGWWGSRSVIGAGYIRWSCQCAGPWCGHHDARSWRDWMRAAGFDITASFCVPEGTVATPCSRLAAGPVSEAALRVNPASTTKARPSLLLVGCFVGAFIVFVAGVVWTNGTYGSRMAWLFAGVLPAAPICCRVRLAGVTQHVEMATKCIGLPRLTAKDTKVRTGSERLHHLFGALRDPVRARPGLAVGLCSPVHRALPVALNDREKPS